MQWSDVLAEPTLRDLPFKIELNAGGLIEMSPTNTAQARRKTKMVQYLSDKLKGGEVLMSAAVQTQNGVRVADVAWRSDTAIQSVGYPSPLPLAPDLCVEVLSNSNTDAEMSAKRGAYFAAGAQEVWFVADDLTITVYTLDGHQSASVIVGEAPRL